MSWNIKDISEIREMLIEKVKEVHIANLIMDIVIDMNHEEMKKQAVRDYLMEKERMRMEKERMRLGQMSHIEQLEEEEKRLSTQWNQLCCQEFETGINEENNTLHDNISERLRDINQQLQGNRITYKMLINLRRTRW